MFLTEYTNVGRIVIVPPGEISLAVLARDIVPFSFLSTTEYSGEKDALTIPPKDSNQLLSNYGVHPIDISFLAHIPVLKSAW